MRPVLLVIIILLTSACINILQSGATVKVDAKETEKGFKDVLTINEVAAIPEKDIFPQQDTRLFFILENRDKDKAAKNVKVKLFDIGGFAPVDIEENIAQVSPLEEKQVQFLAKAPDFNSIGGIKAEVDMEFYARYNFDGRTLFMVPMTTQKEIESAQLSGSTITLSKSVDKESGPIVVDADIVNLPYMVSGELSVFQFVVQSKGDPKLGTLVGSKIAPNNLEVLFPIELFGYSAAYNIETPDGLQYRIPSITFTGRDSPFNNLKSVLSKDSAQFSWYYSGYEQGDFIVDVSLDPTMIDPLEAARGQSPVQATKEFLQWAGYSCSAPIYWNVKKGSDQSEFQVGVVNCRSQPLSEDPVKILDSGTACLKQNDKECSSPSDCISGICQAESTLKCGDTNRLPTCSNSQTPVCNNPGQKPVCQNGGDSKCDSGDTPACIYGTKRTCSGPEQKSRPLFQCRITADKKHISCINAYRSVELINGKSEPLHFRITKTARISEPFRSFPVIINVGKTSLSDAGETNCRTEGYEYEIRGEKRVTVKPLRVP